MTAPTDRMAAALAAVSLIENVKDMTASVPLLPDDLAEAITVLSSTVWCAHFLAESLAKELGTTPAVVLTALRDEVQEMFSHYQPGTTEEGTNQ